MPLECFSNPPTILIGVMHFFDMPRLNPLLTTLTRSCHYWIIVTLHDSRHIKSSTMKCLPWWIPEYSGLSA